MGYRFTILGSGSSGGVPRIGGKDGTGNWGACDPQEPRNRRLRSSFLVETENENGSTRLLIDASPDIRAQLLTAKVSQVDGVAFTHSHADHTHGIDDLRVIHYNCRHKVPVYFDAVTGAELHAKFNYCFEAPDDGNYSPILDARELLINQPFEISGAGGVIEGTPFMQMHGNTHSLGFRFGKLAYATDISSFPESSLPYLEGLDVLIIDALRETEHPCHLSVQQALDIIETYKPKRAYLTHMHVTLDYQTLKNQLPTHVEPAYDGLVINLD